MTTPVLCVFCEKPCDLKVCKITYDGKPIHADCFFELLAEKRNRASPSPLDRTSNDKD